jgi:hypothetical protein
MIVVFMDSRAMELLEVGEVVTMIMATIKF